MGTVCAAGAGRAGWTLTGTGMPPVYTNYADMGKAQERIGYSVDTVESFSNGFTCRQFNVEEHILLNETGKKQESVPALRVSYRKGRESISFSAHKLLASDGQDSIAGGRTPDKSIVCGDDISAGFYRTTYKSVPTDYELTEEDKKNMERPDYEISVGTEQVEINESYAVGWIKDGVMYMIQGFDLTISPDQMLQMAREVIESGTAGEKEEAKQEGKK